MSEHHDKNGSIFKIAANLTIACLISGCIIAGTYYVTADTARKASIKETNDTMKTMVDGSTDIKKVDDKEGWYKVYKGSNIAGYIVPEGSKGYGGTIKMLVAIDTKMKVIDYKILSSNETPGLGSNASKDSFENQFEGKDEKHLIVTKDPSDKDHIEAMSGATITSKAVTLGVKTAEDELQKYLAEGGK